MAPLTRPLAENRSPRQSIARRSPCENRTFQVECLEERTLLSAGSRGEHTAIAGVTGPAYTVERLNQGQPVITQAMFSALNATKEGENISGPSVIRVPSWIDPSDRPDPSAEYYMYFAHHKGNYIRMAWAANVEGPWTLFNVGKANDESVGRGVFDLDIGPAKREVALGNGITIRKHVASPDVFVDDATQQIVMYFHGPIEVDGVKPKRSEKTFVTTSGDGLNFNLPSEGGQVGHGIRPVILSEHYFRVFQYGGELYAVTRAGNLYQAPDAANPWTPPAGFDFRSELWTKLPESQNPFQEDLTSAGLKKHEVRHVALRLEGDTLEVFHTRIGDAPERILYSTIALTSGDLSVWDPTFPPQEILRPEQKWEGAKDPVKPSQSGPAPERVNQLRDPYLFQDDDGRLYLFYSGRGEDAIGVAELFARV